MQRLGNWGAAAALYGLSMSSEETPVAAFRMGECLAALRQRDNALEVLQIAYDLCRGDEHYRALQDRVDLAIRQLESSN